MKKTNGRIGLVFVLHWYKNDFNKLRLFIDSKPNLRLIAGLNMDNPKHIEERLAELEVLLQQKKIVGLKLYPGYQHFFVSEQKVFPVAKLCLKYDKPLVIHSGDVYDLENEAVLKYSHPVYADELAVLFPDLKIVLAHFSFPHLLECANIVSKNKNVYTDISGTIVDDLPKREAENLYKEYKRDMQRVLNYFPDIRSKIMFGTDYGGEDTPLNEVEMYIRLVKEVFAKKEQEHVFSGLAQELFLS